MRLIVNKHSFASAYLCCAMFACYRDSTIDSLSKHAPTEIDSETGAPTIFGNEAVVLTSVPLRAFQTEQQAQSPSFSFVPMRSAPAAVTKGAVGGFGFEFEFQTVTWVADWPDGSSCTIYIDENGDGDLANDPPHQLNRVPGGWTDTILISRVVHHHVVNAAFRVHVDFATHQLTVNYENIRIGVIRGLARDVAFGVVGVWGNYGLPSLLSFFDFDGDGKIDTSPNNDEARLNAEREISLDGRVYKFRVSPDGAHLVLRLVPHAPQPVHPVLRVGAPVPSFSRVSNQGHVISTARLAGKLVLYDFWFMGCAACEADSRRLEALAQRRSDLEIIGVTSDVQGPLLTEFQRSHGMTWNVISEDMFNGVLHVLFRVERAPEYFLVAPSGRFSCVGCTLDDVERLLPDVVP